MTSKLQPIPERQLFSGFRNMLRIENSRWWNKRTILTQSVLWLVAVNFIVAMPFFAAPYIEELEPILLPEALLNFKSIFALVLAFGAVILLQGSLVGEKQSGTAAWILTNPLSRTSFLLAKLVSNLIRIMAVGIILQGAVGYLFLSVVNGAALPIGPYIFAMGLLTLYTLFYISITLMLGSFFNTRGPILGIVVILVIFQDLMGQIIDVVINGFSSLLPNRLSEYVSPVVLGDPLPSIAPVAANIIAVVVFVVVAIWRLYKTEF